MKRSGAIRILALVLVLACLLSVNGMAAETERAAPLAASSAPAGTGALPISAAAHDRMHLTQIASLAAGGANGDQGIYYTAWDRDRESAELAYDPNNWDGCFYCVEETSILNIFPRNGRVVPSEGLSPVIEIQTPEAGRLKIEYSVSRPETTDDGRVGWDGVLFTVERGSAVYAAEHLRGTADTAAGTVVLDVAGGDRIRFVFDKLASHWGDGCDYQITVGYVENEAVTPALPESAIRAAKRLLPVTDGGERMTLSAIHAQAAAGVNGDLGVSYYSYDGTNKVNNLLYDPNTALYWTGADADDQLHISPAQGRIVTSSEYGAVIGICAPEDGVMRLDYRVSRPVESGDTGKGNWDGMIFSIQLGQSCFVYDALNRDSGVSQGTVYLDVLAGESIDLVFDKLGGNWGDHCTYQVTISYENDAAASSPVPRETVKPGQSYAFADLAAAANGENGLTLYYTDGTQLHEFSEYNESLERWYVTGEDGLIAKPCHIQADNYGLGGSSEDQYVVIGYRALVSGSVQLTYWTANQSGAGYDVSAAYGHVSQVVAGSTYRVTSGEDQVKTNSVTIDVTKGEEIYLIYKPVAPVAGDWFGYKAAVTYLTVRQTDDGRHSAALAPLSNDLTLEPIAARNTGETTAAFTDGIATFAYENGSASVVYTIDTNQDTVKHGVIDVSVCVNGGSPVKAVTGAGTNYLTMTGRTLTPVQFAQRARVSMGVSFDAAERRLTLRYTDEYEGIQNEKVYSFCLKGQSLAVTADSGSTNGYGGYSGFTTGYSDGMTTSSIDNSAYVEEVSITNVNDQFFLSAYLDKAKSFGTKIENRPSDRASGSVHGMTAYYERNSFGETNPLSERFYITASEAFLDCAYLTNAQKSPYRDEMVNLVVYDQWYYDLATGGKYSDRKAAYAALAEDYDLTDVLLVEHRWQRDLLDRSNPAFYPASTYWGTAEEFADYVSSVRAQGWKIALHEDYWFIHPSASNQYWNNITDTFPDIQNIAETIAQNADGTFRIGWEEPGFTSYANKSDMMSRYAGVESNRIHTAYGTDASFLDVSGGVDPSLMNQVTFDADSATSRTLAQVTADTVELFKTVKTIYEGPIISEGAQGVRSFGSAYAGHLESGSRELTGGHDGRVMPDYELRYIRPLMVNQGMGPLLRFQTGVTGADFDFDRYNAMTIAYGHAGFIGDVHYDHGLTGQIVNTYYMFRAIQQQYLNAENAIQSIAYYSAAGQELTLEEAVRSGYDFTAARIRIRYGSGLTICLNFSEEDWAVTINGHRYVLDENGYAAENAADGFVQYSCLKDGVRADYVDCTEYTYADPRGHTVSFSEALTVSTQTILPK